MSRVPTMLKSDRSVFEKMLPVKTMVNDKIRFILSQQNTHIHKLNGTFENMIRPD